MKGINQIVIIFGEGRPSALDEAGVLTINIKKSGDHRKDALNAISEIFDFIIGGEVRHESIN